MPFPIDEGGAGDRDRSGSTHHRLVSEGPSALAQAVAARFVDLVGGLAEDRPASAGPVEVAIAGGFVSTTVLPAILLVARALDWSRIRIHWVDERFVACGDADRNDREAMAALFDSTPGVVLAPMPADRGQGLEVARAEYAAWWAEEMAGRRLDLVIAGMGPDGHIASLFPGHDWAHLGTDSPDVLAVEDSPKPPPQRLSLSMPVILGARHLWLAAAGSAKAPVLARAIAGAPPRDLPVAALVTRAQPWARLRASTPLLFLDKEAADPL